MTDNAYRLMFSFVGLWFSMWFLLWSLVTVYRAMRGRDL